MSRDKVHNDFKDVLQSLQPTKDYCSLVSAMFKNAWDWHLAMNDNAVQKIKKDLAQTEKEITTLVDRIMESTNSRVILAYENKIAELEQKKLILIEKASKQVKPKHSYEDIFELLLKFLTNPYKIWEKGVFTVRRIVLKLVFSGTIPVYDPKNGFQTPQNFLFNKGLRHIFEQKKWCP